MAGGSNSMISRAYDVAHELQGTCKSLQEVATDEEINNKEFSQELDTLVFECERCNWWHEISEMADNEEWICEECENE